MLEMIWIAIVIVVVVVVIILILPVQREMRIGLITAVTGMIFASFTLYLNYKGRESMTTQRVIKENDRYWSSHFENFLYYPELEEMHQKMYGPFLSVHEHAMLSSLVQSVENLNTTYKFSQGQNLDSPWISVFKRWISYPEFGIYWNMHYSDFDRETQNLVSLIQNERL